MKPDEHKYVKSRILAYTEEKGGRSRRSGTGSAHCELAPYRAGKLGKNLLAARQVSRRGGSLTCELKGMRVLLSGCAVTVMETSITF
ncbi:MAG: PhzF family phenazine biosynthesis protein [Chlorobium sp.]|nr:PhzF family phenazine biosynthesis protein [Chlorobium sp.]MCF8216931.1 PhzF family phenazine biosynthesis protein [Chlorobium sp.]MCF8271743.1 PhzF family phenazine biosynthesis protein [Chlorobium sp.]MCF8288148.1 PhzF family phenazine biosynthesis protein [Chlorobium sp.]MCF8291722.1 PhzF family phenazine biosynthesis protein [Chlorobium sp.]MCF8385831.1 PhzF family phenazine biosynthesis protein [Chlorobium sp.]